MAEDKTFFCLYNRRKTTRFDVDLEGTLIVKIRDENLNLQEEVSLPVHITNISYHGIMFSYASNEFIFKTIQENSIYNVYDIFFNIFDIDFSFRLDIEWEKFLPEVGKDCKVINGAIITNIFDSKAKDNLLYLLTLLGLKNVFLGLFPKEIEFNKFNDEILSKIDKEEYLNFLLKIYKQDISKNKFVRKDILEEEERKKILEILTYLGY